MKRLAAMQLWPLFWMRAHSPTSTARAMSADGITMKGSAPPSSRTVFLICPPAVFATALPGALAAGQRGCPHAVVLQDLLHPVGADEQGLEHSVGEAGPRRGVLEVERGLGHVRGVLEEGDVAGHEGRRREPDDLPEREVPRHDGEHGSEGLIGHKGSLLGGCGRDGLVGEHASAVLGVVAQAGGTLGDLVASPARSACPSRR